MIWIFALAAVGAFTIAYGLAVGVASLIAVHRIWRSR